MSTHTPGPWFVSGVRRRLNGSEFLNINRFKTETDKDESIALVGYDPRSGLGWTDARLISAAPEMLETLRRMKSDLDSAIAGEGSPRSREDQRADIRAVIAKAEGKS